MKNPGLPQSVGLGTLLYSPRYSVLCFRYYFLLELIVITYNYMFFVCVKYFFLVFAKWVAGFT